MKILVVDIETTGFLNNGGRITEVGIVELCLDTGERKIIFDAVINPEIEREELEKSWIVSKGHMQIDDIMNGKKFVDVKDEIQKIINKYEDGATAFNRDFDVNFLESYGIVFGKKLPCPMLRSTPICKLKKANGYGYKWPKAEEAYKFFHPGSDYIEKHRGADDAMHEADIILALHKNGQYLEK